ncbi:hypothetical protein AD45P3_00330 [Alteromonas phage vB_AmaP_AD45-P3]|nr:hypothetical protein AD45P3_00330 [Alteromonas phage vB_AmaP_AD45-P3]
MTKHFNNKQNKKAFTEEESRILFKAGTDGDTLESVQKKLPKRNRTQLINKLNRMGFGVSKGVIYEPKGTL